MADNIDNNTGGRSRPKRQAKEAAKVQVDKTARHPRKRPRASRKPSSQTNLQADVLVEADAGALAGAPAGTPAGAPTGARADAADAPPLLQLDLGIQKSCGRWYRKIEESYEKCYQNVALPAREMQKNGVANSPEYVLPVATFGPAWSLEDEEKLRAFWSRFSVALQYVAILRTGDRRPWDPTIGDQDAFRFIMKHISAHPRGRKCIREVHREAREVMISKRIILPNFSLSHLFLELEKLIKTPEVAMEPKVDYRIRTIDLKTLTEALDNMTTPTGLRLAPAAVQYEQVMACRPRDLPLPPTAAQLPEFHKATMLEELRRRIQRRRTQREQENQVEQGCLSPGSIASGFSSFEVRVPSPTPSPSFDEEMEEASLELGIFNDIMDMQLMSSTEDFVQSPAGTEAPAALEEVEAFEGPADTEEPASLASCVPQGPPTFELSQFSDLTDPSSVRRAWTVIEKSFQGRTGTAGQAALEEEETVRSPGGMGEPAAMVDQGQVKTEKPDASAAQHRPDKECRAKQETAQ
ncbi:hypothetical protein NLG97_g996 [Lecanicillium saksenae]|uniref:Uncharacterized protein n=1 Tax=Lecanicillium saksenae TaxID=468837 RepID=A0ACC1R7L6_9HYPO|nr:hypothetical protein NLG97_g996 [Lecanicillium saksenae]